MKKSKGSGDKNSKSASFNVQDAIDLGVEVIVDELKKIKEFSEMESAPLDCEYTTQITKYVQTLITVARDNREVSASMDLTKLSDEDLQKLADEAIASDN